jgi:benzoyl-CoA reductase/2-hydroxyglutaryl-CoA dehydratase subunit BcrC/BadD/HgdB
MSASVELPSRTAVIRRWKEQGGAVAAVLPIHYPRALLRAFGLLPVEVWGPPRVDKAAGDGHLQAYTCSIVRCGLSFVLNGGADAADVILVPHTCDSLQALASVLLDFTKPKQLVLTLYVPKAERASDLEFLGKELRRIFERLAELTGKRPTDDELRACMDREQKADDALTRLLTERGKLGVGNREFYGVVRAREFLPAEEFVTLAEAALDKWAALPVPKRTPILATGIVPEPMDVLAALDEAGLCIIADDFASSGRRLYRASKAHDPFERMAKTLLVSDADPTRGCGVQPRIDHLVALAQRTGARGALFYELKFCEPEAFYVPLVTRGLQSAGVHCLAVEVDLSDPMPNQLVTRIEAFAESLP